MNQSLQAVIFDLDGTLWDSSAEVTASWNEVLQTLNPPVRPPLTVDDMRGVMGLMMDDLAAKLFPMLPREERLALMRRCCAHENQYLNKHGANLYGGLEDTLAKLSARYCLFIVSNCQEGYIEAFLAAHKLGGYFTDTENFGHTGLCKGENIQLIMRRNHIEHAVYVGDTQGDCDSTAQAGIPFIWARYGFGSVANYAYAIDAFTQLPEVLEQL